MRERTVKTAGRTFLRFLVIGAIVETAWTVYIGLFLPRQYDANHWNLAWVGLDLLQVSMLVGAAWSASRRRPILALFATSCATLLVMDGWFDVTTARQGGFFESVLLAGLVEIPSALVMLWVAVRSLNHLPVLPVSGEGRRPPPRVTDPLPSIE